MDHEDFLSHLNENITTKSVEELKNEQFSSEVATGKLKFLTVVESLQGVLTNENINTRQKGIEFLSWLLSELPKELFNSSEIKVLVNFYCDCLKGHHNYIPPAIGGLLELIKMKQINKEDLAKIVVTLFQEVNCQTQLQPDRIKIYSILKCVVENYLEDLKEMGPDFVFGIISFIEGESDPYCLIIIFNFLPLFIKNFNLGHLNEELFELLSCYFPIDFNPSTKENVSITREDLAEGLEKSLSASNSMSEQCISLIIEKAGSTLKNAKVDSYKLLKSCCENVTVESLEKHTNELWKCLSKDLLPGNEKQVCDVGLSALTDVIHCLSENESHEKILSAFINDILTTVRSLTNRLDENMFQPAIKVLVATASGSKSATIKILQHLKTFSHLDLNCTQSEKKILLTSLLPFLKLGQENGILENRNSEELSNFMDLINFYLDSTSSPDFETRKLSFFGIAQILPNSSQEFRKKLYEIIIENITTKDDIRISDSFSEVWKYLAKNFPTELYNCVSNRFSNNNNDPCFSNYLWALSLVANFQNFTSFVIPIFIDVINGGEKHVVALESFLNSSRSARHSDGKFFESAHIEHNVTERLISWCDDFDPKDELEKEKTFGLLSEIIALIVRHQCFESQQIIADKMTRSFLSDSSQMNGSGDFVIPAKNSRQIQILESVLGSVKPEVTIPMIHSLREKLTVLCLNTNFDFVRICCSRLLATFVNKSEEVLMLDLLEKISKDIFNCLENGCDMKEKLNSCFLFTFIMKGLILRGGKPSEEWISTWFELLGREDVGEAVAEGFRIVIEDDDLYLNLESHCNVRVLYRQRLFGNYKNLVRMYEMCDSRVKMNYLLALVRLLQGVPIHLIRMEVSNIVTILSLCLDTEKPDVLFTTLEIIVSLLEKKEIIFSDYIQSFVPKLLKLGKFEGAMKIRINALKCLFFYGFYPTIVLLPLKNQVIQQLEACLDDKKRLVRKEAVKARCRWFLVGSPGEDILDS